ncbi:ASCH domain-containing protein [Isoptericola variabilis]|uniref:ASCH domain-containing protein n=1 Tax=Isoptericola variabilis TaxID=139208 RepID=UPI003D1B9C45
MSDDRPRPVTVARQDRPGGAVQDEALAERVAEFWDAARRTAGRVGRAAGAGERVEEWSEDAAPPDAWAFGDSPRLADELLALVLAGRKTAAASLVVEFEDVGDPLPVAGDLSIVLDGRGEPGALIRTTQVEIVPFADVTAEHAWLEGEGDRSIESWRAEHQRAWRGSLVALGRELDPSMLVVCERFTVLFPA